LELAIAKQLIEQIQGEIGAFRRFNHQQDPLFSLRASPNSVNGFFWQTFNNFVELTYSNFM
jgi:hypothetical protein